jgi:hypothetical protein
MSEAIFESMKPPHMEILLLDCFGGGVENHQAYKQIGDH